MNCSNSGPDWRRLAGEELGLRDLDATESDEITNELAAHLEDLHEQYRAQGVPESEAVERTLSEVFDWSELARRIRRAKHGEGIMNDRTRQLWLPGLASFCAAMICELTLGAGALSGESLFYSHAKQLMFASLLVAQLCCGAVGAFLSRRAGGNRSARIAAALFPCGILLVTMFIVIAICAIGRATGLAFAALDLSLLIKPVFVVVLVPSIAMLLGALPFLSDGKPTAIAQ
jgi:hypothetical protein